MTGPRRIPHLASRLQGLGTTIFTEMTALAAEHDAVNLGQGYPDTDGPEAVREAAVAAVRAGRNQYAPGRGVAALRRAVADHQQRTYGLSFDPDEEVTATAGATEAIAATVLALCEVGDEVVMFEPYYDAFAAATAMAGAQRVTVPLVPPGFRPDLDRLAAAITPRTRLLIVNTPHNPTGTVLTPAELSAIADLCVDRDVVAVTDEVYEHLVYDGEHVPLAGIGDMRERTVTISSAGKTFSLTGWKIGWACAPAALTAALRTAKQFLSFANGTPFQYAIAEALRLDPAYYDELVADYRRRRDLLAGGLDDLGLGVVVPGGTYFVTADVRPIGFADGARLCRVLPERAGVAAVPNVALHDDEQLGRPWVRFAFCKTPETLREGLARLESFVRDDVAAREV